MKNYVESSEIVTITSPAAGTTSGKGVLIGTFLFGVATTTTTVGQECAILVEGVVELAKTSALEINIGDKLWWDDNNGVVFKTGAGNVQVGVAVSYAANPSATVWVLMRPVPALAG